MAQHQVCCSYRDIGAVFIVGDISDYIMMDFPKMSWIDSTFRVQNVLSPKAFKNWLIKVSFQDEENDNQIFKLCFGDIFVW